MSSQTDFGIYAPKGAGAYYQRQTRGKEDEIFHLNAESSQWSQSWEAFTPHEKAIILHNYYGTGLGKTMSINNFPKNSDAIYNGFQCIKVPGIVADNEDEQPAWVNAVGLYAFENETFKIATAPLFTVESLAKMVLMDLMGLVDVYDSAIGFCRTHDQLIKQSRQNQTYYVPQIGFPWQDRTDNVFYNGAIYMHSLSWETRTRPLSALLVQLGKVKSSYGMIKDINTNRELNDNEFKFALAMNHVWLGVKERQGINNTYIEKLYEQVINCGDFAIEPSSTYKNEKFSLDVSGPFTLIWVTFQSRNDSGKNNWVKLCDDEGQDFIEELMVYTGSVANEDSLPAKFYRTIKPIEVFQHKPGRFVYVFPFKTKNVKQPTGLLNPINMEKFELRVRIKPHAEILDMHVGGLVYNAWYHEKGTGGKIWQ